MADQLELAFVSAAQNGTLIENIDVDPAAVFVGNGQYTGPGFVVHFRTLLIRLCTPSPG